MVITRAKRKLNLMRLNKLEKSYRRLQRPFQSRTHTVDEVPPAETRYKNGYGTNTYSEWCFTLGLFQELLYRLRPQGAVRMLDVGCGIGRLYLASKPLMRPGDRYTGLDVMADAVDVCRTQYGSDGDCDFIHLAAKNASYAARERFERIPWPIKDNAYNFITALSVWTHLNEPDFFYYLQEVSRVLEPGGKAVITFFIMDDLYDETLPERTAAPSKLYPQSSTKWVFDVPAYDSQAFFAPKWAKVPEAAIGVRKEAFDRAVAEAGLEVSEYMTGWWKERPGYWFQDVVVLTHRT